jgi:hypothetical protein
MNATQFNIKQGGDSGFDLERLTKSKDSVDLAPNTIRAYAKKGLPLYRCGKAVFFSKSELAQFIRQAGSAAPIQTQKAA